jgi:hypothetical protein
MLEEARRTENSQEADEHNGLFSFCMYSYELCTIRHTNSQPSTHLLRRTSQTNTYYVEYWYVFYATFTLSQPRRGRQSRSLPNPKLTLERATKCSACWLLGMTFLPCVCQWLRSPVECSSLYQGSAHRMLRSAVLTVEFQLQCFQRDNRIDPIRKMRGLNLPYRAWIYPSSSVDLAQEFPRSCCGPCLHRFSLWSRPNVSFDIPKNGSLYCSLVTHDSK